MFYISLAVLGTLPWIIVRFYVGHVVDWLQIILTGFCIVSAGFLLTWASDSSRKYISGALAIALVAILAVLPEYAVDIYLSYKAGIDDQYSHYAVANMTGANRLLVGIGWPTILLTYLLFAKRKSEIRLDSHISFDESVRSEIFFLLISTIWSFNIFFKKSINLFDSIFLILVFALYIYRSSIEGVEELEDDFEPVRTINHLKKSLAVPLIVFMFLWAGFCIFISAEAFAEGLISFGKRFGINEFLLIQWLAPFASESPEFVVVLIWALRGRGSDALRALVSSKVNQWTLLIGCIPIAYSLSKFIHGVENPLSGLQLDHRQQWEVFLTSAQSLFAFFIIYDMNFSFLEAILLASLFLIQFFVEHLREEMAFVYLSLCIPLFILKYYKKK